jgi:isomerase DpgB
VVSAGDNGDGLLRIDGAQPLSAATVEAVVAVCDRAEDDAGTGIVQIRLTGTPEPGWTRELTVGLVTKWERAVRRLERLPRVTAAVVSGDCGGTALDVLLATDLRVADRGARLLMPVEEAATWPGMAVYRLVQQAGMSAIRRAVLLGAPIGAAEAVALHLLDRVADDPVGELAAMAGPAGPISPRELAIRRQLMFEASARTFEDALGSHLAACDRALRRGAAS